MRLKIRTKFLTLCEKFKMISIDNSNNIKGNED